jgi:hypothetical protein
VYDIYCVQSPLLADDPRLASSSSSSGQQTTNNSSSNNSSSNNNMADDMEGTCAKKARTMVVDPLRMTVQAAQLFDSVGLDQ